MTVEHFNCVVVGATTSEAQISPNNHIAVLLIMLCCLFIYLFIYVACFYLNFLFFYFFFYILFKSNSRCLLGVAASCVVVFPLKLTCCVSPLAIETTRLERSHTHTHTDTHTLSRSLSLW